MATLITKNSSTASAVPAAGDLVKGELAVNVTDKKVYTKDNSAAVVKLVGSLGNQEASAVAITGGTINGTTIGATTPSTGAFTTASASSGFTGNLTGNVTGNVSGTAANVTGVVAIANGGTGLSSLGTGVQTALGQNVTGSGGIVLATSPSLTTPNLGTPSAAVLTNATGLPLTTGVTGTLGVANGGTGITAFGTGVATALGQNVTGSGGIVLATSPSLTTPNLGTPSAATLTNATGLPLSTGVTGTLATTNGGTGLTSFTANGVVYASSTSALTTGSALSFDGTNLATTGRISTGATLAGLFNTATGAYLQWNYNGTANGYIGTANQAINGGATTDFGISSAGVSSNLVFGVNTTEAMRLTPTSLYTASGINVGIGTSSPSRKLSVVGTTNALMDFNATSFRRFTLGSDGNGFILYDDTASAYRLTVDSSGNLGLGVTPSGYLANKFVINTGTDSNNGITIASATNRNGSIWFADGTTGNQAYRGGVDYQHTNDTLYLYSGGQGNFQLTAAGNLGLGVTPSAWGSGYNALQINNSGIVTNTGGTFIAVASNAYYDGTSYKYVSSAAASLYRQNAGVHDWLRSTSTQTAGTDPVFSASMTLDASGNLGVGTSSPATRLEVNAVSEGEYFRAGGGTISERSLRFSNFTVSGLAGVGHQINVPNAGGVLTFATGSTERARITSGGYFKASSTGVYASSTDSYHELRSSNPTGDWTAVISSSTATSGNAYGVFIKYEAAAPNAATNPFLSCSDNVAQRAAIRSNGGLANYQSNNVDLSDIRTKKEITPAPSYWDKIGALEIVTYKYNDQTHDDVNVGVIAQQVESVEPVWVDAGGFGETPEDGVPLKTVYTKDITFAAIKALQEAMARIEQLEAKVATLEAK